MLAAMPATARPRLPLLLLLDAALPCAQAPQQRMAAAQRLDTESCILDIRRAMGSEQRQPTPRVAGCRSASLNDSNSN
jgi:hypothetical protein